MTLIMRFTKLAMPSVSVGLDETRVEHSPAAFKLLLAKHAEGFGKHQWLANTDLNRLAHTVYRTGSYEGGSGIGERGYSTIDFAPIRFVDRPLPMISSPGVVTEAASRRNPASCESAALAQLLSTMPSAAAPVAVTVPSAPQIDAAQIVRSIASDMLGSVSADAPLMEAGFDSLASVEFRNQLQNKLGDAVVLPDTLVFDFPTIRALEKHIAAAAEAAPPPASQPAPAAAGGASSPGMLAALQMLQAGPAPVAAAAVSVPQIDRCNGSRGRE